MGNTFQYEHKKSNRGKRLSRYSVYSYTKSNLKRLTISELFRMAFLRRGFKQCLIDFVLKDEGSSL